MYGARLDRESFLELITVCTKAEERASVLLRIEPVAAKASSIIKIEDAGLGVDAFLPDQVPPQQHLVFYI